MKPSKPTALTKADSGNLPRFLGYVLPRARHDNEPKVKTYEEFVLHDVPQGSSVSFLDYDGVVLFAGAFERVHSTMMDPPRMVCVSHADLDLREREFFSAVQHGKPVIFLVPHLLQTVGFGGVDPQCDLFRRFAHNLKLGWHCREQPSPVVESYAPEFREYINRFGTGYVEFHVDKQREDLFKPLCGGSDSVFGLVVAGKIFLLPSAVPQNPDQLDRILVAAITATLAYRKRMSSQMPVWVNEFVFTREADLRTQLEDLQKKALELEGEIDRYADFKGALCFQSEPLVKVVSNVLRDFLGVSLTVDDKCIEDATLRDEQDSVLGVFEIKGVKGNFTRGNVNQVDSHRERLGVPTNTPGILIMNTLMDADSIKEKDQRPHPDIIKKAVADGVLLVRTLDLLRYANAVEEGALTREAFRQTILGESGWLKVENGKATVVRG